MHKTVTLFLFLLLISVRIESQDKLKYGIKLGYNSSWQNEYYNDSVEDWGGKIEGFCGGVYLDYFYSSDFTLETELLFIKKGNQAKAIVTNMEFQYGTGEYVEEKTESYFFSLSLLPKIMIDSRFIKIYLIAGPRVDVLISNSVEVSGAEPYKSNRNNALNFMIDKYENLIFGVTIGGGLNISELLPLKLGLEARYSPDLSNLYGSKYYSIKNNSLEILAVVEL